MTTVWEVSVTDGLYFRTSKLFSTREKAVTYLEERARAEYQSMVDRNEEIRRTSHKLGPSRSSDPSLTTSFYQKELERIEECIRNQAPKFEVGCHTELEMKEMTVE